VEQSVEIFVDADACPVKDEVYAAAAQHGLYVTLVANMRMGVPEGGGVELVVVEQGPDIADDWIAEHACRDDVVVTADIPLAGRCLEVGARVVGPNGREFTQDSIGSALAMRQLHQELRGANQQTGGPAPLTRKDRARFSSSLDRVIQAARNALARNSKPTTP